MTKLKSPRHQVTLSRRTWWKPRETRKPDHSSDNEAVIHFRFFGRIFNRIFRNINLHWFKATDRIYIHIPLNFKFQVDWTIDEGATTEWNVRCKAGTNATYGVRDAPSKHVCTCGHNITIHRHEIWADSSGMAIQMWILRLAMRLMWFLGMTQHF